MHAIMPALSFTVGVLDQTNTASILLTWRLHHCPSETYGGLGKPPVLQQVDSSKVFYTTGFYRGNILKEENCIIFSILNQQKPNLVLASTKSYLEDLDPQFSTYGL